MYSHYTLAQELYLIRRIQNTSFIAFVYITPTHTQQDILILMWKMYNFILAPLLFHFHTYVWSQFEWNGI